MLKKPLTVLLFWVAMAGLCAAEPWELDLSAGPTNITAGIHHKTFLDTGYVRSGVTGVFTDDDDLEYKWGSFDLVVGSDTLRPGLSFEIGLRGILGEAEEHSVSGDLGAIGFTTGMGYLFSRDIFPIPLELFGGLTWAPSPLSFRDTDTFFQADVGAGLRVIQNASIIVSYSYYHLDMESGPGDWSINDNVIRAGLMLRF